MAKKIERTTNRNTQAQVAVTALNDATAVVIASADADRIYFQVNHDNAAMGVWIRLYPAAQDNDKRGIFLTPKTGSSVTWEMPVDNVYVGEISAIAEVGNPNAYTTEY